MKDRATCTKTKARRSSTTKSKYVSPGELAERWQCAYSSVARITRRAGLRRFYFGEGRNGMVRYERKEIEQYEESRLA